MSHLYIGIEALSLTAAQRNTLVSHLRSLGPQSGPMPAKITHWRPRLDNLAAIFEAEFDADTVTPLAIRNRLAQIYGVAQSNITYATQQTAYGPVVTYRAANQDRLRLIAFGGVDATWAESHAAVTAYLAANRADWEPAEVGA
jgi:hypothetical protein